MTVILGISAFYHDSASALIIDGKIVSAAQEERFTRIKHDASYPFNAIEYILKNSNLKLKDVDHIVFYEKPFLKFERLLETYLPFAPRGFKSFSLAMPVWLREKLFQKKFIFDNLKRHDKNFKDIDKINFSEHHISHASSAFFPSPFEEAVVLTLDGVGEWATTTLAIGKKNKIEILKEIHFPHSLGLLYSAFTYFLGFKVNSGEYKVMGLAPYGSPKYKDKILSKLIDLKEDGSFRLNMKYFDYPTGLKMTNKNFTKLFGKSVRASETEMIDQFHMDIAASIQAVTEEIILKIVENISKQYQIENLCLAGGVALNCVANGKILKKGYFKNIWIQPAAGDAGGSLGAALFYWYQELNKNRELNLTDSMSGSFLGPKFEDDEIERKLINLKANFKKFSKENMINTVAENLKEQKTVGWFQGRMEFGPRALGSRSILADPRSGKMQKNLNLKIKYRESFRPFAPSIAYEHLNDWFDLSIESPYMLIVSEIKEKLKVQMSNEEKKLFGIEKLNIKRSLIPAVTHVDYSSRIQTVHKDTNPIYHKLINKFNNLTGCPILVNTSFNIRGEPIVCSIEDAYSCFMGTNLDLLAIGNFVLFKKDQNKNLSTNFKSKFELD